MFSNIFNCFLALNIILAGNVLLASPIDNSAVLGTNDPNLLILRDLALAAINQKNGSDGLETFASLCRIWVKTQPSDAKIKEIMDSLQPCWPIAPLNAKGKFPDSFGEYEVDGGCNPNNLIGKACSFHPGAKACYRSHPSINGHNNQCCYSDNAHLIVGPPNGGTLDMASGFNHVIQDVLPYLYCCRLSDQCNLYYQKRPSDDGSRWVPPYPNKV